MLRQVPNIHVNAELIHNGWWIIWAKTVDVY